MRQALFLLMFVALGCQGGPKPSKDILDRAKFKEVLIGAQLIEARMNHELMVDQQSMIPAEQYYADLFTEQEVTKAQFDSTFAYYSVRPDELKVIYEEIMTVLSHRKDSLDQ